jgi:hypothetical protein
VAGVQLAGLFQNLVAGLRFQVALSAKTVLSAPSESVRTMAQEAMGDFMAAIMPMALFESKAHSYRTHTPAFCLSSHYQPYT